MSSTLKPEDQAFFDLVTRFLNEANAMNDREHRSRISAAILFAAQNLGSATNVATFSARYDMLGATTAMHGVARSRLKAECSNTNSGARCDRFA